MKPVWMILKHDVDFGDAYWQTGTILKVLETKGDNILVRPKHHRDSTAVWIPKAELE